MTTEEQQQPERETAGENLTSATGISFISAFSTVHKQYELQTTHTSNIIQNICFILYIFSFTKNYKSN